MRASPQVLLTLPMAMADAGRRGTARFPAGAMAVADPPGGHLGSGGGTVRVLREAWKADGGGRSWTDWLREGRRVVVHGGGQSRRLPAYAVTGKPFIPMPVLRQSRGQRLDQSLLDLQLPDYLRLLESASSRTVVMVASGDVLVRLGEGIPLVPEADVVGIGIPLSPEEARGFGVYFVSRQAPGNLAFFLQKPEPDRIRELAGEYTALVDSGIWLLSERAVEVLARKCGWRGEELPVSEAWEPSTYELYAGMGLALGSQPTVSDAEVGGLTCSVVAMPEADFFHLGTSRQLIDAVSALHNDGGGQGRRGLMAAWGHPNQHVQNSRFDLPLRREANRTLWIENCTIPSTWRLASEHVLTNVPANDWALELDPGVCLDFVPVGEADVAVRCYGIDDVFRGAVGATETRWLGRSVLGWLAARGLTWGDLGVGRETDLQEAPLFPVVAPALLDTGLLRWLWAGAPVVRAEYSDWWRGVRRCSAAELMRSVNLHRLLEQRRANRLACLEPLVRNAGRSVFFQLDLEATAELLAQGDRAEGLGTTAVDGWQPMQEVRTQMVRGAVLRVRGAEGAEACEDTAFGRLRELIEDRARLEPSRPRCSVLQDQIVWGRSPVRLDLGGGWTDTPPYCLEHGGKVVNLAVDLNGQPPLQVFGRVAERPELVIRSIDLGTELRIRTYEELATFAQPGSEFALAKAGMALAGFLPRFHVEGGAESLEKQLRDFGGGLELSLLAAVPKGSGLGTSSILAATLLATLSDLCGLGWDRQDLFARTLALEQMVTTGGGWQDQAGGLFRGVKLIETGPGLVQRPTVRWLPDHLFGPEYANRSVLLYYTGLTRLARGILHEVVRGVFLNSPRHLGVLQEIRATADLAFGAIQEADYGALGAAIRRSWELNQALDVGTNPPAVAGIPARVQDYLSACKLLGAGGGGYLLMLAKDPEAAARARSALLGDPPNPRARFVDFSVSGTGLQLTRS